MSDAAALFLDRLQVATNAHDLDGVVECFTADYRNEAPVHPSRAFVGNEQVRANWQQIFAFVPDINVRVLAQAASGPEVWSEWEMRGTRRDGTAHLLRGAIVFVLLEGRARSARFYLEPVEEAAGTIDQAVRDQIHAGSAS